MIKHNYLNLSFFKKVLIGKWYNSNWNDIEINIKLSHTNKSLLSSPFNYSIKVASIFNICSNIKAFCYIFIFSSEILFFYPSSRTLSISPSPSSHNISNPSLDTLLTFSSGSKTNSSITYSLIPRVKWSWWSPISNFIDFCYKCFAFGDY